MKKTKQINNEKTGQIEIPGKCLLYEVEDNIWQDKPDSEGWWWSADKINSRWKIEVDKLFYVDNELYDNEGYPVRIWKGCKWMKITEPILPKE